MKRLFLILCLLWVLSAPSWAVSAAPPADDPTPPAEPIKLIFIHHSTGGNWLADPNSDQPYGGLGLALMENNYFVSATNYGWGPDGIGDRTDIPNWPEWFTGPNRDVYLDALYHESGQNVGDFGAWSRLPSDPGGENVIVMFKSCFPNSDLYGNPDDPPLAEPNDYDYTVANAKAVYINLLTYFETRLDKLFVVITAPPLQESETAPDRAANARAFNDWLVNDWLRDYPYANVAVFDYYNVLTAPDNHHRWNGSAIEHVQATDSNVSAYPSGDSHPSTAGHQKATAEFVPLLNVYYNRWRASAPTQPIGPTAGPAPAEATAAAPPAEPPPALGVIDDFESTAAGWQPFWDEATSTVISCAPDGSAAHAGAQALHVEFNVAANSWATCALFFDRPQDWSAADGLSFYLHAGQPALIFDVDVYRSGPEDRETYLFTVETVPESVDGWVPITLSWEQFLRAGWEAEAGTPFSDPAHVDGLAFGFSTYPDAPNVGAIWIDDLRLTGAEAAAPAEEQPSQPAPATAPPGVSAATEPAEGQSGREGPGGGPCSGATVLPLAALGVVLATRRDRTTVR